MIGIARSFTSPEVRALATDHPDTETDALRGWLGAGVRQVDDGLARALGD